MALSANSNTPVLTLSNLPAGDHVVSASVSLTNQGTGIDAVNCYIVGGTDPDLWKSSVPVAGWAMVSVNDATTVGSGGVITFDCSSTKGL